MNWIRRSSEVGIFPALGACVIVSIIDFVIAYLHRSIADAVAAGVLWLVVAPALAFLWYRRGWWPWPRRRTGKR